MDSKETLEIQAKAVGHIAILLPVFRSNGTEGEIFAAILSRTEKVYAHLNHATPSDIWLTASACRNLLELFIVEKYLMVAPEQAVRFVHDAYNDHLELTSALKKGLEDKGRDTTLVNSVIAAYERHKAKHIPNSNRLRIEDIARMVGLNKEHEYISKLCSKYVHATSLVIMDELRDTPAYDLYPLLHQRGTKYAFLIVSCAVERLKIMQEAHPSRVQ